MKASYKIKVKKDEPFDYVQKIIIIGDSGVGKSNILLRYTEGKFVDNYMMTIGINYVYKVVDIEGVKIKLQIWDTAGQQKFKTITQTYYRNSEGVLIVFGINSRDSFYSIQRWIEDLTTIGANSAQIMIVGNKADLNDNREVTYQEANQLAQNYGVTYIECSAKTGQNINDIFSFLGEKMKQKFIDEVTSQQKPKQHSDNKLQLNTKTIRQKCCSDS